VNEKRGSRDEASVLPNGNVVQRGKPAMPKYNGGSVSIYFFWTFCFYIGLGDRHQTGKQISARNEILRSGAR